MKIAILQNNYIVGDIPGNAAKVIAGYQMACALGPDLVVGTELMLFGYPPKDLLLNKKLVEYQRQVALAFRQVVQSQGVGLILGVATMSGFGNLLSNAAWLFDGQNITGTWKTFLPTYDVFDETRYFRPKEFSYVPLYKFRDKLISILICEDLWGGNEANRANLYQGNLISQLAEGKVNSPDLRYKPDFLVAVNASPYNWGKGDIRFNLVSGIAKRLGCSVIYANQVGGNDDLVFDGCSFVVDAKGNCIGAAKAFEEDLLIVDLDKPVPQSYPSDTDNLADLHDALVLGIRDYCHKTGFSQTVIGLSGGIDSAVTVALAVQALGSENVLGVAMPSPYSSPESVFDARKLAENLKINLRMASIEHLYQDAIRSLQVAINWYEPNEATGSITDQNIQARLRGLTLMAISNREGRLVLATGNKSEIAVGYCTLYGDMCGGFAPISDLPKTLVYRLADYINRKREIIPLRTITKPPSAELAPGQKDTDSLPPYEILDPILQLYIEEQMGIEEIVERGFDEVVVRDVIKKVNGAEYKRHQMPPGLKVTTKAFGSGRRMPIATKFFP